jgi:hypothetical protein
MFLRNVHRLLVTANVVPSLPILVSLMMEALRSSETSVLTRATRRNIPENSILDVVLSLVHCCGWSKVSGLLEAQLTGPTFTAD